MNTDLARHVQNAFQERFGNDFVDVKLCGLPHEIHGTVRMKNVRPGMKFLAQSIETELDEMDLQVTIDVIAAEAKSGPRFIFSIAWFCRNVLSRVRPSSHRVGL
jgi:hypothetical protein